LGTQQHWPLLYSLFAPLKSAPVNSALWETVEITGGHVSFEPRNAQGQQITKEDLNLKFQKNKRTLLL